jgi:squid-like protein
LPYLPEKVSEEMLKTHFGRFGRVVDIFIPVAKTAKEKRIAFVSYHTYAEAMACARQPRQMINNKVVEVYKASPKPGGKAEPPMGAKGGKAGGKPSAMAFKNKK